MCDDEASDTNAVCCVFGGLVVVVGVAWGAREHRARDRPRLAEASERRAKRGV